MPGSLRVVPSGKRVTNFVGYIYSARILEVVDMIFRADFLSENVMWVFWLTVVLLFLKPFMSY